MIMPYQIEQLQGGYQYLKVKEHSLQIRIAVDVLCPHTFVTVTELCMDDDELDCGGSKYTGIFGATVL
jgi:hypothetical protein